MTQLSMPSPTAVGARTEVELSIELSPERFWELITDVSRIGEWSPECVYAAWLDEVTEPGVGDRFEARNEYPDGQKSHVRCVVTHSEHARTFGWVVLDETDDPERPGTVWRYDLLSTASPDRTVVRQSFEHGPGSTGLSAGMANDSQRANAILEGRLGQLRRNMTRTIEAMAQAA